MKHWVIVSKTCENCGGEIAVRILTEKPTEPQIKENRESLGGMFCIETYVVSVEINSEESSIIKKL